MREVCWQPHEDCPSPPIDWRSRLKELERMLQAPLTQNRRQMYCVQITARKGWQEKNEAAWPVKSYLYWRPEQIEDNHGPGGFAGYHCTKKLVGATFFDTFEEATGAVEWMKKRYQGIICAVRRFEEVSLNAGLSKKARRPRGP